MRGLRCKRGNSTSSESSIYNSENAPALFRAHVFYPLLDLGTLVSVSAAARHAAEFLFQKMGVCFISAFLYTCKYFF